MRKRIVEVRGDLGDGARPQYRYGSGFVVGGRWVLTAAHVIAGAVAVMVRDSAKHEHPALLHTEYVGDPDRLDLALVELTALADEFEWVPVAVIDRDSESGAFVDGCWATGFPQFGEVRAPGRKGTVRKSIQVGGRVAPLSNLDDGMLSLGVQERPAEQPLPAGDVTLAQSAWSGMSGAALVAGGYLVGVVAEHAARRGASDITVAPLALLDDPSRAPANAPDWWRELGVSDPAGLPRLPRPDDALRELIGEIISNRTGDISNSTGVPVGQSVREVINQLDVPLDALAKLLDLRIAAGDRLGVETSRFRWGVIVADRTRDFVGREHVFAAIEDFVATGPSGYFVIEGEPGFGKSSILSEYVLRTGCIAHFNVRSMGISSAARFLESVCSQLIVATKLSYTSLPDTATEDGAFLLQLVGEAAAKASRPLVIAVDALDEVNRSTQRAGSNVLYLPDFLPDGVFFVMTQRPVETWLPNADRLEKMRLEDYPDQNKADVAAYVRKALERPALLEWGKRQGLDHDKIVTRLSALSKANFMYLRYVLPAIEHGEYRDLHIDRLPAGLRRYYVDHWRHMGMADSPSQEKRRIVYMLCEAQRPIPAWVIAELASVDEDVVEQVLADWREFIHEEPGDGDSLCSLYHTSFRDFLHDQRTIGRAMKIEDIHGQIAACLSREIELELEPLLSP
jgi:Trypsin-like peptidase domain